MDFCFTKPWLAVAIFLFSFRLQAVSVADSPSIDDQLAKLSLDEKIGQLFMIGFMGSDLSHGLSKSLLEIKPGAILFFGRNVHSVEQVHKLCSDAQSASKRNTGLPLLIAVDQEGGDVTRVRLSEPLPSAEALALLRNPDTVRAAAAATGEMLKSLGFNMDLAPVMDVTDAKSDHFLGTRSFGKDARSVSQMASAFADGLEASGILPTVKHFPGHGGLNQDSHHRAPIKNLSIAELLKKDLIPFADSAKKSHPPAVMLAHISLPKVDPSGKPATFSKIITSDLLRGQLKFDGLVVTDDIEMGGASQVQNVEDRSVEAIEAGADLITIGWNKKLQSRLKASLLKAVTSGRISEQRINESVRRILLHKARYANTQINKAYKPEAVLEVLRKINLQIVSKSFATAETDSSKKFWQDEASSSLLVFSASNGFNANIARALGASKKFRILPLGREVNQDPNRILRSEPTSVALFYLSGPRSAAIANRFSEDTAARTMLINTEAESALEHPEYFKEVIQIHFRHYLTAYRAAQILSPALGVRVRVPASGPHP